MMCCTGIVLELLFTFSVIVIAQISDCRDRLRVLLHAQPHRQGHPGGHEQDYPQQVPILLRPGHDIDVPGMY